MKKILFVNSSLSGGGSEKVMTILANGFSDRNYSVDMVLVREGKNNTQMPALDALAFLF